MRSLKSSATLTVEQCRAMLAYMRRSDAALFASLLLFGGAARCWTWQLVNALQLDIPADLLSNIPCKFPVTDPIWCAKDGAKPYTTHEVTRRMKRYARLAGIEPSQVSLRTVVNTRHLLMKIYGDTFRLAKALRLFSLVDPTHAVQALHVAWMPAGAQRLVGIGRRKSMVG